ncbi:hypothetical protein [Pseudomonas sp. CCOS 191]|uniref:hypothetical protein n=1 Tax=Pseudomonas sp. CCOS 191 TaxID=1649877 RepID=UPI000624B154|nr:hypothetical protein [Pseudomonas sp. CCOS 191]CRI58660.1 hypothetical protein CCOS191_4124 [Pseudomonas sp. CCOS 191]
MAAQGIEFYDPSGHRIMDGTTRLARILGSFQVPVYYWDVSKFGAVPAGYPGPWTGTIGNADLAQGTPFVVPVADAALWAATPRGYSVNSNFVLPNFIFSDASITWRYDWKHIVPVGDVVWWGFGGIRVYYGVY